MKTKYRLGQRDNGVFFWEDTDTLEQGTFRTTDKSEAEREVNDWNEMHRQEMMLHREWKVGDVVELNSGGGAMTIVELLERSVLCNWMSYGRFQKRTFPKNVLKVSQPKKHRRRSASKRHRKSSSEVVPDSSSSGPQQQSPTSSSSAPTDSGPES